MLNCTEVQFPPGCDRETREGHTNYRELPTTVGVLQNFAFRVCKYYLSVVVGELSVVVGN